MEVKHRKREDKCSHVEDNTRQQKRKNLQEMFHQIKFLGKNVLKLLTEVLLLGVSILFCKDEKLCGDLYDHREGGKDGENLGEEDAVQRSSGEKDDKLEEELEDAGGEDPGHVKGEALLAGCRAEEGEEIAATKSSLDTLLPAYHQDLVEESEKEEGNERNGEGLACGRDPPLRRHGRLDQTHNSQANGWKLKECQSHNLKLKKKKLHVALD